jgi:formyl-CoA transferase
MDVIREGVTAWAADKTSMQACHELSAAGVAAGPVLSAAQVMADPHLAARHMLVEVPRTDGIADPIVVPGNPVKMSKVAEGPETRPPWLGEHTDAVLSAELGLGAAELAVLRADGVIA